MPATPGPGSQRPLLNPPRLVLAALPSPCEAGPSQASQLRGSTRQPPGRDAPAGGQTAQRLSCAPSLTVLRPLHSPALTSPCCPLSLGGWAVVCALGVGGSCTCSCRADRPVMTGTVAVLAARPRCTCPRSLLGPLPVSLHLWQVPPGAVRERGAPGVCSRSPHSCWLPTGSPLLWGLGCSVLAALPQPLECMDGRLCVFNLS